TGVQTCALPISEEQRQELATRREEAERTYREIARAVSRSRRAARARLERGVVAELDELAMEGARFRVELHEEPGAGPLGLERVEFHFSANAGEEPRALERVASGGELARLLLALRTVAADLEPSRIAVFH